MNPEIPPTPPPGPRHFHRLIFLCKCGFNVHRRFAVGGSVYDCDEDYHVSFWRICCPACTGEGKLFQRDGERYRDLLSRLTDTEKRELGHSTRGSGWYDDWSQSLRNSDAYYDWQGQRRFEEYVEDQEGFEFVQIKRDG